MLSLVFTAVLITAFASQGSGTRDTPSGFEPILLFPGLMGSQLDVVKRPHNVLNACNYKLRHSIPTWVNLLRIPCWKSEMFLAYNPHTKKHEQKPGIKVEIEDKEHFGSTAPVDSLGGIGIKFIDQFMPAAFKHLVKSFVGKGYKRGEDFRAAPYDWRYAADELDEQGYYNDVKALIEDMVGDYGKKVNLLVSSYGGPISHYFLTKYKGIDQKWKDDHIAKYFTMAGAWAGGNNVALHVYLTGIEKVGDHFHLPHNPQEFLHDMLKSWQCALWLGPNPTVWGDEVIVTTNKGKYSAKNFDKLFKDHNIGDYSTERYEQVKDISFVNGEFPPPRVPTYCMYGSNQSTPKAFDYTGCPTFPDCHESQIKVIMDEDGDSLVTKRGAEMCLQWKDTQSQHFEAHKFPISHSKGAQMVDFMCTVLGIPVDLHIKDEMEVDKRVNDEL